MDGGVVVTRVVPPEVVRDGHDDVRRCKRCGGAGCCADPYRQQAGEPHQNKARALPFVHVLFFAAELWAQFRLHSHV